ncbi:hypothetical protein ACFO9E_16850 [Streptomyces maoxianensis]|uniref:Uncharacterized protein n=1 Tax=Streptomyces maoxianensis TaxID=1459942 RepID=A0ABV9G8T3_9ACTN
MSSGFITLRAAGVAVVLVLAPAATAAYAADSVKVTVVPATVAPGGEVEVRVSGCTGMTGGARSQGFVANAALASRNGAGTQLFGETTVKTSVKPGTYDIGVTCDGREHAGSARVQVVSSQPTEEATKRAERPAQGRPDQATKRADHSTERPDQATKRPDEATKRAERPAERPDQATKRPDEATKRAERPAERPDQATKRAEEPTKRAEQPTKRAEEPKKRAERPAERPDQPTKRAEEPKKRAERPAKRPEESTKRAERPAERPDHSTKRPDHPTEQSDHSTDESDESDESDEAVEEPYEPADDSTPYAPVRAGGGGTAALAADGPAHSADAGPSIPHAVIGLVLAGVAAVAVAFRSSRRRRSDSD